MKVERMILSSNKRKEYLPKNMHRTQNTGMEDWKDENYIIWHTRNSKVIT
jgi:hypothetical protein